MPRMSQALTDVLASQCAIARSLGVLSDSWSFLLIREALLGRRTFAQFRDSLGIATDVLSARLNMLVEHGVLERTPYQEPGQRTRDAYDLTAAGDELKVVLLAMQQWGEVHVPQERGLSVLPVTRDGQEPVRVSMVDTHGRIVPNENMEFVRVVAPDATGDEQPANVPC